MTNEEYFQHAQRCGLDMTSATAIGIDNDEDARGCCLAHAVLDPEYQDVLLWPGTCLTRRSIQWMRSFGVDYVTVRA